LPAVDVKNTEKFLNDLKLSPYWKVEKNRAGDFEAHARGISSGDAASKASGRFLFEQAFGPEASLPEDWQISNRGVQSVATASSISATIVFKKPAGAQVSFEAEDGTAQLIIFSMFPDDRNIDANALSTLGIKISRESGVYLLIQEQGKDKQRAATFAEASALIPAVDSLVKLPEKYKVREQYAPFFKKLFPEAPQDVMLKRRAGLQDRDTFYGYFRVKPGLSYEGVNIKVTHAMYAGGEATRERDRLAKAEYLGKPMVDEDWLFFLIEDNAVYLLPQFNAQFGTFSGKKAFDGILEILNGDGKMLHQSTEPFKGWER